jgi:hypothetical protein
MSADAHRILDRADDARLTSGDSDDMAYWRTPARNSTDPAEWLEYADKARAAAQAHDAARIAYFAAEQAARARAAELTTAETNAPLSRSSAEAAGSED